MFDKLEIMRMAHGMATHASARQQVLAGNIAQADTPGFRAKDVASFADTYASDADGGMRRTRAGHFGAQISPSAQPVAIDAGGSAAPNGNTVSLETEMMKSVEVKHQHDVALSVYRTSLDILRTSLGRGR